MLTKKNEWTITVQVPLSLSLSSMFQVKVCTSQQKQGALYIQNGYSIFSKFLIKHDLVPHRGEKIPRSSRQSSTLPVTLSSPFSISYFEREKNGSLKEKSYTHQAGDLLRQALLLGKKSWTGIGRHGSVFILLLLPLPFFTFVVFALVFSRLFCLPHLLFSGKVSLPIRFSVFAIRNGPAYVYFFPRESARI